jgi:hypothetical protein
MIEGFLLMLELALMLLLVRGIWYMSKNVQSSDGLGYFAFPDNTESTVTQPRNNATDGGKLDA